MFKIVQVRDFINTVILPSKHYKNERKSTIEHKQKLHYLVSSYSCLHSKIHTLHNKKKNITRIPGHALDGSRAHLEMSPNRLLGRHIGRPLKSRGRRALINSMDVYGIKSSGIFRLFKLPLVFRIND